MFCMSFIHSQETFKLETYRRVLLSILDVDPQNLTDITTKKGALR